MLDNDAVMPHRFASVDPFADNEAVKSFMRAVAAPTPQASNLTRVPPREEKDFLARVAWPVGAEAADREAQVLALQRFAQLTSGEDGVRMVLHFRACRDKLMAKNRLSKGLAFLVMLIPEGGREGVLAECFNAATVPEYLRDPQLQKTAANLIEDLLAR